MELLKKALDLLLHFEKYLDSIALEYGIIIYIILFLIIFCETGLVVTPFLPGDSLLFAVGAIAARGSLSFPVVLILLPLAAIIGDTVNYFIGRWVGPKVFHYEKSRWFNPKHLQEAHAFYEKYGGITITIGRFIPIVRTFVPFVAGVGTMRYTHFTFFNIIGAVLWVVGFLCAGFFFGNIPVIKSNFKLVVIGIILISVLPMVIAWIRSKMKSAAEAPKG
ncbi:MAG: DedA family protein [Spirochaetes bacterium]|nr:DedA family protein [Spirochaetota bacterium]